MPSPAPSGRSRTGAGEWRASTRSSCSSRTTSSFPTLHDLCPATPSVVVEQTATYYDTADLRLSRAGASLRYRSDDGWTVKLATRPSSSPESGDTGDDAIVRSELCSAANPDLRPPTRWLSSQHSHAPARWRPATRLHTARHRSELQGVGTLTDDECTVLEGRVRTRFRELELELNDDAPSAVVADVVGPPARVGCR